jgi:hypothetical protein
MKKQTRKNFVPPSESVETEIGTVTLSSDELAIAQRVNAVTDDFKFIKESEVDDYALAEDPMKLPDEAKKRQDAKQYAFRWISRTAERMDEMRNKDIPFRWWVCNATTAPFLEGSFDPVYGCVCKLDQMLVMKPWNMYQAERRFFQGLADRQMMGGELQKKDGLSKGHEGQKLEYGRSIEAADTIVSDDVDSLVRGDNPVDYDTSPPPE